MQRNQLVWLFLGWLVGWLSFGEGVRGACFGLVWFFPKILYFELIQVRNFSLVLIQPELKLSLGCIKFFLEKSQHRIIGRFTWGRCWLWFLWHQAVLARDRIDHVWRNFTLLTEDSSCYTTRTQHLSKSCDACKNSFLWYQWGNQEDSESDGICTQGSSK